MDTIPPIILKQIHSHDIEAVDELRFLNQEIVRNIIGGKVPYNENLLQEAKLIVSECDKILSI